MNVRRAAGGGAALTVVLAASAGLVRRRRRRQTEATIAGDSEANRAGGRAVLSTSRLGRIGRLWGIVARGGIRRAILRARVWTADEDRRDALNEEYAIRTAADVAAQLGQMRGVLMKVGQMASSIVETLPESTRLALASLQESAPPMDPALAAQVVAEDLGAAPEKLFASWEPVPAASASIGQVHEATTVAGERVAVKVQYPGVRDAIESDLSNTSLLYQLIGRWFDSLNTEALVEEFRDRITEELDYRLEAANQIEFASMFAGHPWVRIPTVIPELSSERVLTSEWIDGSRLVDFVESATDQARQRAAEVIWRYSQYSIHRHHIFNGDPHPGNFRFHPDGTVAFLDYGMVKRWHPAEWAELRLTLDAVILDRDPERICAAMRASGFLAADRAVDPVRTAEFVCAPYEPYLVDEFAFTAGWMADALGRSTSFGAENADIVNALNIPPSFLILNRVVWGINALMAKLGARGPYRSMLLEYLSGTEPATELGIAEATWRAHHVRGGPD